MVGKNLRGALRRSHGEGVVGEGVDASHDTLGGLPERFDRRLDKEGSIDSGDLEAVLEVELGGWAIEASQGIADGKSLSESLSGR